MGVHCFQDYVNAVIYAHGFQSRSMVRQYSVIVYRNNELTNDDISKMEEV